MLGIEIWTLKPMRCFCCSRRHSDNDVIQPANKPPTGHQRIQSS